MALRLERSFSMEEINEPVFSLADDKAPGPNVFIVAFIQERSEIDKWDLLKVLTGFLENGKISKAMNLTVISLIHEKKKRKKRKMELNE